MEDKVSDPGNSEWEKRIDQAEGNAKTQAQNEAPLVRHHVAAKPLVRPQCLPDHLPQIWLGFFGFSLAHQLMKLAPLPAQIEGNS